MEQTNALSMVEKNALQVSYNVLGTEVNLDIDFVKKYLVRGRSELVNNQELIMFINTCKMQRLNPLSNGEVYLIKYSKEEPAQLVVGKDAYSKRAFLNPNYLGKKDGIVVLRGNDVIKKEGCCLYPTETLIGGWCRVFYVRNGKERESYKEVALSEYNKGMANWKSKPATMINKVAMAQCLRDAFPADFEGVYSEDELVASGVMQENDAGARVITETEQVIVDEDGVVHLPEEDRVITQDERKILFAKAQGKFGKEEGNKFIKECLDGLGIESSTTLAKSQYDAIMERIEKNEEEQNPTDIPDDSTDTE